METLFIVVGALFILLGLMGSLLPGIPGLAISYLGLLMLQFTKNPPFSVMFLIIMALVVVLVSTMENFIPAYGTKKWGGTRYGIIGAIAGLFFGLIFFPPIGIIIGPLAGAFLGESIGGATSDKAFRSAIGSFIGLLAGTLLKVITALVIGYYFITHI